MKLTNALRSEIIENIVKATDLPDLKAELKKSMDKFANEYARSFLDKKFIAATAQLPRHWFRTVCSISIHPKQHPVEIAMYREEGERNTRWMMDYGIESFAAPMSMRINSIDKDEDAPKLVPLIAEAKAIAERERAMRATLKATLAAFNTVEALVKDFPEFERHCPKQPAKSYPVAVNTQPVIDMLVAAGFDKGLKQPKAAAKPAAKAPVKRRTTKA